MIDEVQIAENIELLAKIYAGNDDFIKTLKKLELPKEADQQLSDAIQIILLSNNAILEKEIEFLLKIIGTTIEV